MLFNESEKNMIITAIEEQKKNKARRSVFIDGEFAFGLSAEDVYLYRLREGDKITAEQLDKIKATAVLQDAKNLALRYLSYSARTKNEMVRKLKTYDLDEEIINEVLSFLEAHKFIDDFSYAQKFAQSKTRSGYGKQRLKSDLFQKGIPRDIIDEVLQNISDTEDSVEKIKEILEKKIKSDDIKEFNKAEKQKIYNFLGRRGFSFDEAKKGIRLYWEERLT